MNKLSISQAAGMNIMYSRFPFDYFLQSMSRLEVQNIELWGGTPHFYPFDLTLKEVGQFRKMVESHGLKIICYTPEQCNYPINIAEKEKKLRERSVEYFTKSIEITAELGTNMLLVTSGWGNFVEPIEEPWKRAAESLSLISDKATEAGITLLLEPLTKFESNLVTDLSTLKTMMEEIGGNSIKGMVDVVPMHFAGETIEDYKRELGDDFAHIHLIDGDGKTASHMALGDGVLPLKDYLRSIRDIDYANYITLEVIGTRYLTDPEKAMRQSLDYLRRAIDEVNKY